MTIFRRILVPVDFSLHADEALRLAAQLSRLCEAPLTVLHVYEIRVYPILDGMIAPSPDQLAQLFGESQKLVERTVDQARAAGAFRVDGDQVEGAPFAEIVRYARTHEHDLIVMGTHGHTGLRHALLGSVAEKVVRKAPCAVLTVRLAEHRFEHP